jgi:hypothetical protein
LIVARKEVDHVCLIEHGLDHIAASWSCAAASGSFAAAPSSSSTRWFEARFIPPARVGVGWDGAGQESLRQKFCGSMSALVLYWMMS